MSRFLLALSGWCLALAGCSVTALAEREESIASNHCVVNSDCPGQPCVDSLCSAATGSLSTVLFEVLPRASVGQIAGAHLFKVVEDLPLAISSADFRYALRLNDLSTVTGQVTASLPSGCDVLFKGADGASLLPQASDGSIPARVRFSPVERMWGLAAQNTDAPLPTGLSGVTPASYPFQVQLPGGAFDVYVTPFDVEPSSVMSAHCVLPPYLIRSLELGGTTSLKLAVPTPTHLDLSVRWPEGAQSLDGWSIDLLEPITGQVISTRVELKLPTSEAGSLVYAAPVDYIPVLNDDPSVTGSELVRLSPPANVVAPSLYFDRAGLSLFSPNTGVIDKLAAFPTPISFEGSVVAAASGDGVPASVTLTATEISGVPVGTYPSFIRQTATASDGTFKLQLLPGTYDVVAVPVASVDAQQAPLASARTTWKVLTSPAEQAGSAILLNASTTLTGNVFTSVGGGARGAQVTAQVAPASVASNVFDRATGHFSDEQVPLVPRAVNALIENQSGAFTMYAEPGIYDFSVRPPDGSGFAWLVVPGLNLLATSGAVALPDLSLPPPLPVPLSALLVDRANSVAQLSGAAVRLYALLDDKGSPTTDPRAAKSAVRVAETRLDANANATVLLPAQLNSPITF